MENEIVEEIFSGFCRTFNQGQTVTCEFREHDGQYELTEVDCAYDRCINKGSCEVARQIREYMG